MRIKKGFTLIEAIMMLALLSVISFSLGNFIVSSINLWVFLSARQDTTKSAQLAMNRMVSELKDISSGGLTYSVSREITFTDIDGNTIDFRQTGTNLIRKLNGTDNTLATNLGSPEGLNIQYLDSNRTATAVDANVRSIRVTLTIMAGNQRATLESGARIRAYDLK